LSVCLVFLAACSTTGSIDLKKLETQYGIVVTEGDPPPDAKPVRMVYASSTGWYPLGFIPIVPIAWQSCMAKLAKMAKAAGAEGVSNVESRYEPTHFLALQPFWPTTLVVHGMAWTR
jgi:hypothetical protein